MLSDDDTDMVENDEQRDHSIPIKDIMVVQDADDPPEDAMGGTCYQETQMGNRIVDPVTV